eukprot:CAMPEP_0169145460 /NCGR_PEP_ID=MMETSP1015-20121227/46929_1 /TAXON_ID=342587 /ORGANISM="Karlodinium micrum, Strain CCMP2283" /LENGTH=140 /DNA_ID=CAMNT_0009213063 /DNA_START=46 /DNA_END=467 /DNA_ORIENTATION=-
MSLPDSPMRCQRFSLSSGSILSSSAFTFGLTATPQLPRAISPNSWVLDHLASSEEDPQQHFYAATASSISPLAFGQGSCTLRKRLHVAKCPTAWLYHGNEDRRARLLGSDGATYAQRDSDASTSPHRDLFISQSSPRAVC